MDIFVSGNIRRLLMISIIFKNFKNLSSPLNIIRLYAKELYKILAIIWLHPNNILIKHNLYIQKKWTHIFIKQ